jgi:hypothetical protein
VKRCPSYFVEPQLYYSITRVPLYTLCVHLSLICTRKVVTLSNSSYLILSQFLRLTDAEHAGLPLQREADSLLHWCESSAAIATEHTIAQQVCCRSDLVPVRSRAHSAHTSSFFIIVLCGTTFHSFHHAIFTRSALLQEDAGRDHRCSIPPFTTATTHRYGAICGTIIQSPGLEKSDAA